MGFPPLLNLPTAAMPGQTTKTALTEEFMFQNVAYWPTVYITGSATRALSSEAAFSLFREISIPNGEIAQIQSDNNSHVYPKQSMHH